MQTSIDKDIPPRQRILAAANGLFYRHGIRAVGVEAIAEAACTNKMTLYRHFASKEALVAEYLREAARAADGCWERLALAHPGDPLAQLLGWLEEMAGHLVDSEGRGCPLANAAIELPEKHHPARRVIEQSKRALRTRLIRLSEQAGLSEPEVVAEELQLLLEGGRVMAQSVGTEGLVERVLHMGQATITAHLPQECRGG